MKWEHFKYGEITDDNQVIATVHPVKRDNQDYWGEIDWKRTDFHRNLVAAAPEQNEALVEALAWFDGTQDYGDCPPDWVTKARDAIRKVKGESE